MKSDKKQLEEVVLRDLTDNGPTGPIPSNLKSYIGTKCILAEPMNERSFLVEVKGKTEHEVQSQETQGDGYKVIYEDGYVSWSPKEVFEKCYREISHKEKTLILNH